MVLFKKRFGCCSSNGLLFDLSLYLFYPTITCVNLFARLFRPTTEERRLRAENDPCYQFICVFAFSFPFLLAGLLLSLPFSFLGFLLWFPLQFCRRPYVYFEHPYVDSSAIPTWAPSSRNSFKIASANVCLLPEFASRVNNLNAPANRAGVIAERIIADTKSDEKGSSVPPRVEVVVLTAGERFDGACSTDSLLKCRNMDNHSTDGTLLLTEEASEPPGSIHAADEKASQRSLYSQLNQVKAMENPILSLRDHRLEPADIRSKEFDSNLCLTSANHSVAALDNASCDDKTETGSVNEESYANGPKMKATVFSMDETSSINSSVMTSAAPNHPVTSTHSAPAEGERGGGDADAGSESMASFDTVDAVSVKNLHNSSVSKAMLSSAPPDFKLSLSSQKDGASLISENLSNFDAVDGVVIGDPTAAHHLRVVDAFVHGIDLRFPNDLDFLCLCEVFDKGAARSVLDALSEHFPYIVYDIAARPSFRFCNSGLLFASKHPILDVEFRKYDAHEGSDSLACKGVLLVKLRVGRLKDGTDVVGFVVQTHIQARVSERSGEYQLKQLDRAVDDIRRFRDKEREANEVVGFDILSGDLNFDSVSDSDKTRWAHPLFTQLYVDPCRESSGEDRSWAVGTELLQPFLYDEEVATPEALRQTLADETRRALYVASTEHEGIDNENGKRRIDYICYGRVPNRRFTTDLRRFSFVTSLASLTDHVPIAMHFDVVLDQVRE